MPWTWTLSQNTGLVISLVERERERDKVRERLLPVFDAVNLNTVAEHRVDYLVELVRVVDSGDDKTRWDCIRFFGLALALWHLVLMSYLKKFLEQSTVLVSYSSLDHRLFEGCIKNRSTLKTFWDMTGDEMDLGRSTLSFNLKRGTEW